jgi:hypothetical protein
MHSMLRPRQPDLPHLAYHRNAKKFAEVSVKILAQAEPGLTVSTVGGAFGPTWPPDVEHSLDFLEHFRGLNHLRVSLPNLSSLEPLVHVQDTLETLSIAGFEKPNKTSLAPLSQCLHLKSLGLTRMTKDVGVVWQLPNLEQLSFTGYNDRDLQPSNPHKKLRTIYLGFGGMEHIDLVGQMPNLAAIEIFRVKGLTDLSPLSSLTKLQYVALGDLSRITQFPNCSALRKLRRVYLDTLNGLEDLSGLLLAPALEDLIAVNCRVQPDVVMPLAKHRKLKRATIGLSSLSATRNVDEAFGTRAINVFGTSEELFTLQ